MPIGANAKKTTRHDEHVEGVPLPVTTCCWGAGPPPRVVWRTLTALGALLLHSGVQHLIWSVGGWVWVLQALISAPRPASIRLNVYRCRARGGQHQGRLWQIDGQVTLSPWLLSYVIPFRLLQIISDVSIITLKCASLGLSVDYRHK